METSNERTQVAEAMKPVVIKAKVTMQNAKEKLKKVKEEFDTHDANLKAVTARLKQLETGKGKQIIISPVATIYEFWIETPSYSGPIKGTHCTVRQTGDIKVVPITTGDRTGGIMGALIGGAVAGQKGAVAGSILQRQNKVKTETKTIDTRQFDIDIKGNGWAWSATVGANDGDNSRKLRDAINMRGSSNEDINRLIADQKQKEEQSTKKRFEAFNIVSDVESELKKVTTEYDKIWKEYSEIRLPLIDDLKHRWSKSNITNRALVCLSGFLLLLCFLSPLAYIYGGLISQTYAIGIVVGGVALSVLFCWLYFAKVRLLRC